MLMVYSESEDKTVKIGEILGGCLESGHVVCLEGDLGSGKTVLARGIAKGMGINDYITSPTFVLVNEYRGNKLLYHFDVYRLRGADEFLDSGLDEYFDGSGVIVVEWADRITNAIPTEHIQVVIKEGQDVNMREICICFLGKGYKKTESQFREKLVGLI